MAKKIKSEQVNDLSKRKKYSKISMNDRMAIITEVTSGLIGYGEAARKHRVSRASMFHWINDATVQQLLDEEPNTIVNPIDLNMKTTQQEKILVQKIRALTSKLEHANLKITGLETMINVAEEELKIKIRKKLGTKQSRECDKAI